MLFIEWLSKVANDAILQYTRADIIVSVGGNENRWNHTTRIHEVSVELNAGHHRHVDVSDQASSFIKTRRCEKIGWRCEGLNSIAQRPHEPFH
jgi:hypothetical protein